MGKPTAMAAEKKTTLGLTVKRDEDFSEWYNQIVQKARIAEYSPVKGCMIILPYGYALWEKIQATLDTAIKQHGVQNAYFPLFIPESFFKREAEHAKGFAPEVAWIANKEEDSERLAVRPTSETIIADSFAKWTRSHRDLPLRINQWCNVVRWETKMTKLFLRTREFLWQEGHCIYATQAEADKETMLFLQEYQTLAQDLLAIPVIPGKKTAAEAFAGAFYTTTIEALMPDGKALQMGTSHNLGQGFMHSFNVTFLDEQGKKQTPWYISWGVSTRMIGGLIMTHSDDKGLILPPSIAPIHAVIIPILFDDSKADVLKKAREIQKTLTKKHTVQVDDREHYMPGWKYNEWELKGVPIRIELGPKDLAKDQVVVVRRDTNAKENIAIKNLAAHIETLLATIQETMYAKAKKHLDSHIVRAKTWKEFETAIKERNLVLTPFCERPACETKIKEKTTATSRCTPFDQKQIKEKCTHCGEPATHLVLFGKSY